MARRTLPFVKMQALGNDFVVIDGCDHPFDLSAAEIRLLADRHRGVGCDQVLLIQPSDEPAAADFIYRIFNADGYEVAQCGNGARCVARYLIDRDRGSHALVRLKTQLGVIEAVVGVADGSVTLNIGPPQAWTDLPFDTHYARLLDTGLYQLTETTNSPAFVVVGVGNPHAVIYDAQAAFETQQLTLWGELFNQHSAFPEGINVGCVHRVNDYTIRLWVYERGVGQTLACGSGACAAVVAAKQQGWLSSGSQPIQVEQPGGKLTVVWSGALAAPIFLTGPTQESFEGDWYRPNH